MGPGLRSQAGPGRPHLDPHRPPPETPSAGSDLIDTTQDTLSIVSDLTDTEASLLSSPVPRSATASPIGESLEPPSVSPWSSSSEQPAGYGFPEQTQQADRVFPIRSVLVLDNPGRSTGDKAEHSTRPVSESDSLPGRHERAAGFEDIRPSRRMGSESAASNTVPSECSGTVTSPTERGPATVRKNTLRTSEDSSGLVGGSSTISALNDFATDMSDESGSQPDATGRPIVKAPSSSYARSQTESDPLVTVRFRHVMTEEGHAVITGREETLQRCEDEPIHAPGAVQGFGLLITVAEDAAGRLVVRHVSENSKQIIGYSPQELFRLNSFLDILTDEQADNLLDHIDFIKDEEADPGVNGPEVFTLSIRPAKAKSIKLWCAIHVNPAMPDLVICEFELHDDPVNPMRPPDEDVPDAPEDTLKSNPTPDELHESTEVLSKPLRVLRGARKRRGEAGAMQVFDIMSQVHEQLAKAPTLEVLLKILAGIVKELTGFHRVMIYQFDSSFNGKVVTELVDPLQTRDLYKGLHFPASDIPRQARELYKVNKVRILYDRDQETARLVCRTAEDLEQALDLTHSYLRAMSTIHLKYLRNMAVRSSMSISIDAFGELWGLIACHSYGSRGMRVSFPVRKMCRLVGETASRNIERLSYVTRLQARKLINTIPTEQNPSGYIIASSDDLLRLFDADFGTLSIHGETKILGKLEQSQEALVMLEYLRLRRFASVMTSQDISMDFPDLRYPPGFTVIAGCLYVPLSVGGNDFIAFYRKGQVREVKWAGNPYEKVVREGTAAYLEPRSSFRVWNETILGKCREWTVEQVETAAVLCLVYGKFIEVWRQKEAALQNSKLTKLLLANQAHEVRTPLNAIINYLEIAMEGTLDQETRDNLARSHSASKSLIYVINDLLDLTKAEEGRELVKDEAFDLATCIREATEPFRADAKRKGIDYEVVTRPGLPSAVYGDQRKVRTALANITANAFQHTIEGWVKVEVLVAEAEDRKVRVEFVVQDTGCGMDDAQLDAIFRELEQVTDDVGEEQAVTAPSTTETEVGGSAAPPTSASSKPTLGLGLAVVSRTIRTLDGQLRLKSEPGKGSRFTMQLCFELPPGGASDSLEDESRHSERLMDPSSHTPSVGTVRAGDGEVTLVDRGTSPDAGNTGGPVLTSLDSASIMSNRSTGSKGSGGSSRSDADRLIDAIQLPLAIGTPEPRRLSLQRKNSRGPYYNVASGNSPTALVTTARSLSPEALSPSAAITRSASVPAISPDADPGEVGDFDASGVRLVTDSRTPLRPVKVPDDEEFRDAPHRRQTGRESGILFALGPDQIEPAVAAAQHELHQQQQPPPQSAASQKFGGSLHVLCAEDDPVNMKLLRKRLEKAGHVVTHAVNGEDCAVAFKEAPMSFDVVLMDMQMPIADGLTSTKMIRAHEESNGLATGLSDTADKVRRIPIFAISASLLESKRNVYVKAGFDGWILKPIDFKRLKTLLTGIPDEKVRRECFYRPGNWEIGGWFGESSDEQPPTQPKSAVES